MSNKPKTTKVNLGQLRDMQTGTDWHRVDALTEADILAAAKNDPDALPLDDAFFAAARKLPPAALLHETKQQITLRVDADVVDWFKSLGKGYQSRMNAVLKAYVQTHRQGGGAC